MAWFKYDWALKRSPGDPYDHSYQPGTPTNFAGIYRCDGCGCEIGIAQGHILPPQNHHRHGQEDGPIMWRLTVWADHRPADQQR